LWSRSAGTTCFGARWPCFGTLDYHWGGAGCVAPTILTGWSSLANLPFFAVFPRHLFILDVFACVVFVRTFVGTFCLRVLYPQRPLYALRVLVGRYVSGIHSTLFGKMRTSILAPLFCLAATSLAQGPPEGVAPDAAAPEGCKTTVEGKFMIGTLDNPTLRRRETAQEVCLSLNIITWKERKEGIMDNFASLRCKRVPGTFIKIMTTPMRSLPQRAILHLLPIHSTFTTQLPPSPGFRRRPPLHALGRHPSRPIRPHRLRRRKPPIPIRRPTPSRRNLHRRLRRLRQRLARHRRLNPLVALHERRIRKPVR
jgi:hypothetical protein